MSATFRWNRTCRPAALIAALAVRNFSIRPWRLSKPCLPESRPLMPERRTKKPPSLGFGVVGCGVIAPTHCDAISQVKGATLVAVCDTVPEKAAKIGERYGVPHYTDLAAFLQHPGLDV